MPPEDSPSPLILLDGGLGTTLADRYSISFSQSTPLWSSHLLLTSSGRETLKEAQSAFASAGADVILSATYQASYEGFERSGVGEREAGRCMRDAVGIAVAAAENRGGKGNGNGNGGGKVALSLGAYGATIVPSQEYSGDYDEEHRSVEGLLDWHFRRIEAFMPGEGVDGLERGKCWESIDMVAFETLPRVDEIFAVREVMEKVNGRVGDGGKKEFWVCCVFPGEGNVLPDGSSVREVVEAMLGKGKGAIPMGVGINCTRVGKVEGLVLEFEKEIEGMIGRGEVEAGEWPSLGVYPDGTRGEVYDTVKKEWVRSGEKEESSVSWDETIFEIVSRARGRRLWKSIFVGGCCKTTPDDIGKLRERIDAS